MATKHNDPCLHKAGDDEPIFVLRSTDMFAPILVRLWASMVRALNPRAEKKWSEAVGLAAEMDRWQDEHGCKIPD